LPTFRYDIVDGVKDPEGPFLCLPKIFDVRSDITTQALAEKGSAEGKRKEKRRKRGRESFPARKGGKDSRPVFLNVINNQVVCRVVIPCPGVG